MPGPPLLLAAWTFYDIFPRPGILFIYPGGGRQPCPGVSRKNGRPGWFYYLFPPRFTRNLDIKKEDLPGLLYMAGAFWFILAMLCNPQAAFEGAAQGLKAWWEIIFPALLPFFILSHLLMELGFFQLVGCLLEPLMRHLFRVPGEGGLVVILGLVGGAPVNGMLTARLYKQGALDRGEAQRLLVFSNFCSPFFMLAALPAGMLQRPGLGLLIASAHYLSNLALALALRSYPWKGPAGHRYRGPGACSLSQALQRLLRHQRRERQPLGQLLGQAATSSVSSMSLIGAYIIFFGAALKMLEGSGLLTLVSRSLALVLAPLGIPPSIFPALAGGLLETTLGCQMASQAAAGEIYRLAAIGALLGWAGVSVQAQVAGMLAGTGLGLRLFLVSRAFQACLAAFFTVLLYPVLAPGVSGAGPPLDPFYLQPALSPVPPPLLHLPFSGWLLQLLLLATALALAAALALLFSLAQAALRLAGSFRGTP